MHQKVAALEARAAEMAAATQAREDILHAGRVAVEDQLKQHEAEAKREVGRLRSEKESLGAELETARSTAEQATAEIAALSEQLQAATTAAAEASEALRTAETAAEENGAALTAQREALSDELTGVTEAAQRREEKAAAEASEELARLKDEAQGLRNEAAEAESKHESELRDTEDMLVEAQAQVRFRLCLRVFVGVTHAIYPTLPDYCVCVCACVYVCGVAEVEEASGRVESRGMFAPVVFWGK